MISLKHISYETNSKEKILDNISLEIKKGEFIVITGQSGSGKSTLGSVINGLILHYYDGTLSGEAYINGKNVNDLTLSQIGGMVGTVFQDPRSQFFMPDVFNEVAFGCSNMQLSREEILKRTEASLQMFGITHLNNRNMFQLSSGEKQKAAIASCYAMSPDIYLLDEPTANLDIQSIFDLKEILRNLKSEGKTIIVLEHRLFYLPELLDRIIVLNNGRIECEYSKNELNLIQVKNETIRNIYPDAINVENNKPVETCQMPLFEVKNLSYIHSKKDREYLFKDISMSAYEKEIIGIIGENGVGKTTFAKLCAGLLKEKSGTIRINAKGLNYKERLGKIYFVMQDSDFQLFSNTVEAELDIGNLKNRLTDNEKEFVLSKFEILDLKKRHPMTLSRGQKQRLTIAAGFSNDCKVFFFDEPTSGLDKKSMDLVSKNIFNFANTDKLVFVISHDYEFLLSVCNRIIYFEHSTIKDDFPLNNHTKEKLWNLLSKGRK